MHPIEIIFSALGKNKTKETLKQSTEKYDGLNWISRSYFGTAYYAVSVTLLNIFGG